MLPRSLLDFTEKIMNSRHAIERNAQNQILLKNNIHTRNFEICAQMMQPPKKATETITPCSERLLLSPF
jgi:hypothetical protein